jgi:hypothetical protein
VHAYWVPPAGEQSNSPGQPAAGSQSSVQNRCSPLVAQRLLLHWSLVVQAAPSSPLVVGGGGTVLMQAPVAPAGAQVKPEGHGLALSQSWLQTFTPDAVTHRSDWQSLLKEQDSPRAFFVGGGGGGGGVGVPGMHSPIAPPALAHMNPVGQACCVGSHCSEHRVPFPGTEMQRVDLHSDGEEQTSPSFLVARLALLGSQASLTLPPETGTH